MSTLSQRAAAFALTCAAITLAVWSLPSHARVTRIVIDEVKALAEAESGGLASEQIAGRAFGELDASAAANALINDVLLARDPDGKVRYVATHGSRWRSAMATTLATWQRCAKPANAPWPRASC